MFLTRQLLRNNNLKLISKRNQKFFSSTPFQHSNTNTKLVATTIAAIVGGAAGISYFTTDGNNNGNVLLAEDVETLTALSKKEFKTFPVVKNEILSKDTNLITFKLPSEENTLGLTVASCLSMSAEIDGKTVNRPYTPISRRNQQGTAEFIIKSYPPRTDGKPGGMGRHLRSLKPGDSIKMKGPWGKFAYNANEFEEVGMIAGGTGITPMFQIIQEILYNEDDNTKIKLLYANKSIDDILIKEKLDNLQKEFPTRFNVSYTVDKAPWWWQLSGETGFVTKQMVERCVFSANNKQKFKIFVCGPQPMVSLSSIPSIFIDNDLYIII